jgi:actin-related protein
MQEKFAVSAFESLGAPALNLTRQGVLAIHASGRSTGLAVDLGYDASHISPIYEGIPLSRAVSRLPLGALNVTDYLIETTAKHGHCWSTTLERMLASDLRERICYVAENYEQVIGSTAPSATETYRLPDGEAVTVDSEGILAPEILFKPSLAKLDEAGIHRHAFDSIVKCDFSIRSILYRNIVLVREDLYYRRSAN